MIYIYMCTHMYTAVYVYILTGPGVPWISRHANAKLKIVIRCLRELTQASAWKVPRKKKLAWSLRGPRLWI